MFSDAESAVKRLLNKQRSNNHNNERINKTQSNNKRRQSKRCVTMV